MKTCRTCKQEKDETEFYDHYVHCKKCVSEARHKRYVSDMDYYINNRYNVIKQRAEGRYPYPTGSKGKPFCTREEFLKWFDETKDVFDAMWKIYVDSNMELTLAPSVDRIDSEKGYELGNLQWLTQSDNASKNNK